MNEREAYFMEQIDQRPNAELYERLMEYKHEFTPEQIVLGITPLFSGETKADEVAVAYLNRELKEHIKKENEKSMYEQEKPRIQELIEGTFKLPQSVDDLLQNADKRIERLQADSDMIEKDSEYLAPHIKKYPDGFYKPIIRALEEDKEKIVNLNEQGLLS